jgi:hypothetical protein
MAKAGLTVPGGLPADSPARELLEAKTTMLNPHHQHTGGGPDPPRYALIEVIAELLRP